MFAIVKTGGKQHRIEVGDEFKVEKLEDNAGSQILLNDVIMMGEGKDVKIGKPFVEGAGVAVEILEHARARKIIVFKRKRRQNYRRTNGHRQHYSLLKVLDIMPDASKFTAKKAAAPKVEAKEADAKKAEAKAEVKAAPKKASAKKATAKKAAAKKPTAEKP